MKSSIHTTRPFRLDRNIVLFFRSFGTAIHTDPSFTRSLTVGAIMVALAILPAVLGGTTAPGDMTPLPAPFITTWKTDNPGSASNTVYYPGIGVNYTIYWENLANPAQSGTLTGNGVTLITFPQAGTFRVHASPGMGTFTGFTIRSSMIDRLKLLQVNQWGSIAWSTMADAFTNCENMDVVATDIPDLSLVTSMSRMFAGCKSLKGPGNINDWNTSGVTNMTAVFSGAFLFNQPLGNWDVSQVTNMGNMFEDATQFDQNLEKWDVSNVSSMYFMFKGAASFNQSLENWDVRRVMTMESMFRYAKLFNQSLGNWTFRPAVTTLNMLQDCGMDCENYSLSLQGWASNLSNPNFLTMDASGMKFGFHVISERYFLINNRGWTINGDFLEVSGCGPVLPFVTTWKTDNPGSSNTTIVYPAIGTSYMIYWENTANTSIRGMFFGTNVTTINVPVPGTYRVYVGNGLGTFNAFQMRLNTQDRLKLLEVNQWGTVPWLTMVDAFQLCENMEVTATDIPNMNYITEMSRMFYSCQSMSGPANINDWDVSNVEKMDGMFFNTPSFNQPLDRWNTANVKDMSSMFKFATSFNQPIGSWDVGKVANMNNMFNNAHSFNQPINSWDVGNVHDMSAMFFAANSFNRSLGHWNVGHANYMANMFFYATSFNKPIGNWDVSQVIDMTGMFMGASAFNQDISGWDVSQVIRMPLMFASAYAFQQPIGSWDVSNVVDMNSMFFHATAFNHDLSNWNVANVVNMGNMFYGATAFNQPLAAWNTANVHWMNGTFFNASAFNQDLGAWPLTACLSMGNMLDNSGMDCDSYSSTLVGWSANPLTPVGLTLGAQGMLYGNDALDARTHLTTVKGWTINGDSPSGTDCICPDLIGDLQPITGPDRICLGADSAVYYQPFPTGANTLHWYLDGVEMQVGSDPSASYFSTDFFLSPGQHKVCVDASHVPCIVVGKLPEAMCMTVDVIAPPVVEPYSNSPVCKGETIQLGVDNGTTFVWTGPNGFMSTERYPAIPEADFADQGDYYVLVTDEYGCVNSGYTTVAVLPLPDAEAYSNAPICALQTLELGADGGTWYHWTGPNGFGSEEQFPMLLEAGESASGLYVVTVTDGMGCSSVASTDVWIMPRPEGVAYNNGPVPSGGTAELFTFGGIDYLWNGPLGFESTDPNPSIWNVRPQHAGTYSVTITNVHGCSAVGRTDLEVIEVLPNAIGQQEDCAGCPTLEARDGVTSSSERLRIEQLAVYPNPASDLMVLEVPSLVLGEANVVIRDLAGRSVWQGNLPGGRTSMDVSALQPGSYFLSIQGQGVLYRTAFVKF